MLSLSKSANVMSASVLNLLLNSARMGRFKPATLIMFDQVKELYASIAYDAVSLTANIG